MVLPLSVSFIFLSSLRCNGSGIRAIVDQGVLGATVAEVLQEVFEVWIIP